jgi:hypothetical protein
MKFFIIVVIIAFAYYAVADHEDDDDDDHHKGGRKRRPKEKKLCPPTPCDDIRVNVTIDQLDGIWYLQLHNERPYELNVTKCNYANHTVFGSSVMRYQDVFKDE